MIEALEKTSREHGLPLLVANRKDGSWLIYIAPDAKDRMALLLDAALQIEMRSERPQGEPMNPARPIGGEPAKTWMTYIESLESRVAALEAMRVSIEKVTQATHPGFAARLDEIYLITQAHAPKAGTNSGV